MNRRQATFQSLYVSRNYRRYLSGQVVSLSFSIADALLKRETATPDNKAFVEEFADKLLVGAGSGAARN